ncbi:histidine phosphatase family protein [Methylicorpusculum sp.]|uniref:histidine phosphatase family protein n=1 Tax=Methylicorpusculum sp. TaxID=2713644 RepID=UPI002723CD0F|nr:histidine phosphatase family protein [Methylicorpusculum sp.]MDO8844091.1 histidine phosphatase family protein [Methylicorpusculum sp.]
MNSQQSRDFGDNDLLSRDENVAKPLHLYLIRHGETEWAISGRHTGSSDIPLTTNGENEARELGKHIRDIAFEHVLCSPLKRARRTCELVSLDQAPEIEADLAEWAFGDYEGLHLAEILQIHPGWNVLADGCPNGEMPAQILARTDRLIARLRQLKGNVALFSHGKFGGILAARWIGLPITEASHFPLGTASVSMLGYDHHHPEVSVIDLWNVVGHKSLDTLKLAGTAEIG